MNYLGIAITEARQAATRLATETHWNTWDAPIHRNQQQAACGAYVDLARFSTQPTCPACRQQRPSTTLVFGVVRRERAAICPRLHARPGPENRLPGTRR
jgi:hypothetical protein